MMDVFYLCTLLWLWRTKNGNPLFPPSLPAFEAIAFQFRAAEANNFGPEMQA